MTLNQDITEELATLSEHSGHRKKYRNRHAIAVQNYANSLCYVFFFFQFPVCDGSHNKHNELTGDNVGPLILKKKEV